jgi:signal transduction histidine kinase
LSDPTVERLIDALALAVHDMGEPLREAHGFGELLARRTEDRLAPEEEELLAHVLAGSRRLQGMVAGLGEYVRAERAELDVRAVAVPDLLDEGVVVAEVPAVAGDRRLLAGLFSELVGNARKFGSSSIAVRGWREEERVVVEVSDDGIGVPEGDRERVLRLFQRAHARDEYAGAGVGLTIASAIAARHGGVLSLHEREGGGTVVRVVLPAA